MRRHLGWIAPTLVLAIAAVLRFWALGWPHTLVFDEIYYVRDAISQLAHGYPTTWPDAEPDMSGERATAFTAEAANAVHPPLGKWLIGIGILIFGPGSGWGWRSAVAVAGVLTVAIVMRTGWLLSRSLVVACLAGLLLAIDGVHVVLTRVGLLDGFLTLFIALGALCVVQDQLAVARRDATRAAIPVTWGRPWMLAAAATFGAAAAIKWSGLYPLAFFLVFVTVRDLLARRRSSAPRPWLDAAAQAWILAVLALPLAALVYLASWVGWITTAGGWGRIPGVPWFTALINYHREMLGWHGTLSAPHPFQSNPLTWPLALRPTAMYEERWTEGCPWNECVAGITPLPNPIVTWGGVIALVVLAWLAARALRAGKLVGSAAEPQRTNAPIMLPLTASVGFVLTGYLSGWLPWVATVSRPAVFQFYAVVLTPFSALGLALLIGILCRFATLPAPQNTLFAVSPDELQGRRIAAALFVLVAVLLAILFFPVWSGQPIADWFWQAHMWLPGWD